MLRAIHVNEARIPNGTWFAFEVEPQPPLEQLKMVIADIDTNIGIYLLENGVLTHSTLCCEQSHKLNSRLESVVKDMESQTFNIAVWEGKDTVLNGQPVAISIKPEISYNVFSDHPHLNVGYNGQHYCLPDSICYTDNPQELGNEPYSRALEAIQQTCIWLFKHQVWIASTKTGKGIWIGPEKITKEKEQFFYLRNPYANCRCNSKKVYHKCHLNQDFMNACNTENILLSPEHKFSRFKNSDGCINLEDYYKWWNINRLMPHNRSLNQLKKIFL